MSSIPGYTLEKFVMWQYDLIVGGDDTANWSLMAVEKLGTAKKRRTELTTEEFAPILALFESHREWVEIKLDDFDEQDHGWRDYAAYNFDFIPDEVYRQAEALLDALPKE